MKSKHTPGPWIVSKLDGLNPALMIGPANNSFFTTAYIARASGFDSTEIKANAQLIAAAPEMLEALEHPSLGVAFSIMNKYASGEFASKHWGGVDPNSILGEVYQALAVYFTNKENIVKKARGY